MTITSRQIGQLLTDLSGWNPEPKPPSAKWIAIFVGFLAGIGIYGLSTSADSPDNIYAAIIGSIIFGLIAYTGVTPAAGDNEISIEIRGQEQVAVVMEALHKAGFVVAQADAPATGKEAQSDCRS